MTTEIARQTDHRWRNGISASTAVFRLLTGLLFTLIAGFAQAKTINVEPWGSDDPTCGSRTAPCESVTHAVSSQATRNDRIVVGPGTYDTLLNINFNLSGPLDGLRIESRAGQHATFFRASVDGLPMVAVRQPRVRIGKRNKGFTFLVEHGANIASAAIEISDVGGERTTVEGNLFVGGPVAILATGDLHKFRYNRMRDQTEAALDCSYCDHARIISNQIHSANDGILISSSANLLIQKNRILDSAFRGMRLANFVSNESPNARILDNVIVDSSSSGISVSSLEGYTIRGNIVSGSGDFGIYLDQDGDVKRSNINNNMVVAGGMAGIILQNTIDSRVERNTSIQNDDEGIQVSLGTLGVLSRNNTWSNDFAGQGVGLDAGVSPIPYKRHFFGDPAGPDQDADADGIDAAFESFPATSTSNTRPNTTRVTRAAKL